MGSFVKGDVVVLPFPFSNLRSNKKRPALIVATMEGDDIIVSQITASRTDQYSISLSNRDFISGCLPLDSNIRPNRLFTADSHLILKKAGVLSAPKIKEVIDKIIDIVSN
jgi:mRNA interferase MazF